MSLCVFADFLQRDPEDTCTQGLLLHFGYWRDLDGVWYPQIPNLRPRLRWHAKLLRATSRYPGRRLPQLQVLPDRPMRPGEIVTTITFAPTRAAWRRAYRLARRLLQAGTVIVREPPGTRADVAVELGPDHEVLVWAESGRACA